LQKKTKRNTARYPYIIIYARKSPKPRYPILYWASYAYLQQQQHWDRDFTIFSYIPVQNKCIIIYIYCNNVVTTAAIWTGGGAGISLLRKDRLRARFTNGRHRRSRLGCFAYIIIIKYYNSWSRRR